MTIHEVIDYYKKNIEYNWQEEKYKWEALKHYKDHWCIDAEDFAGMVAESFRLANNLLAGGMYYAYRLLCELSKQDPEKMRGLFRLLYDESLPLVDRYQQFRSACKQMVETAKADSDELQKTKNHYQDLRAICVYLSFEYPEKYFLYKYKMYADFKELVGYKETSQEKDPEIRKYDNFSILCKEVLKEIKGDSELQKKQKALIDAAPDCYSDPEYHLLTQTIIYVSAEYEDDYIEWEQSAKSSALADDGIETRRYWIYSPGEFGSIWGECCKDGIMAIGWEEIGDLTQYSSKDEMKKAMKKAIDPSLSYKNAAHATWQFANEMKPGDIVFAKKGAYKILGRGVVTSDYRFDAARKSYNNIRSVNWTDKGEWPHPGYAVMKTLTDITPYTEYVGKLNALFEKEIDDNGGGEPPQPDYPPYEASDFLEEVFMDENGYNTLVDLLRAKKNVILQGAPGVGKTFAAKRLAYSMMGVKDPNRVMMVQFHQSYSYEDFIMGFRPSETGFDLKKGVFYNFCKEAEIDSDNDYFFIIDEINRGNLSKIFGELFMLIENDKRGIELQLLYSDEKFSVPKNVYIIGMMNTADRSLAMLDYALRRRFAFFDLQPGFETEGFLKYKAKLNSDKFNRLIGCVENLNTTIAADESLGEGFRIGHSYFCNLKQATDQALSRIVEFELIPLLKEYWFDEPTKVKDWSNLLRSSIK